MLKKKEKITTDLLNIEQLEAELEREQRRVGNLSILIGTLCMLPVIAAIVIIVVNYLPIMQIHGTSMQPTLSAGDLVVCIKGENYEVGDVVALEYDDKILIKRIVAGGKDWVDIDEEGNLLVNGEVQEEPYVSNRVKGECSSMLPCQVPKNEWYILGDNREFSGDSRLSEIGTVTDEQIIGKVAFRMWPFESFGAIG